jgi:hypothetical protein
VAALLLLLLLQVDLQGQHHALDAVAVAAQSAHVFTNPTLYK